MENHPLTPMNNPNLVRVLQAQTRSNVGLIAHDTIANGAEAVQDKIKLMCGRGIRFAIVDALSDTDLTILGEACASSKLITGGSGIGLGLARNFGWEGLLRDSRSAGELAAIAGRAVALAGSASTATNAQVAAWCTNRPAFRVDPFRLSHGEQIVDQAIEFALSNKQPVLIFATATSEEVKHVQRELGIGAAGHLVEQALASIASGLRDRGMQPPLHAQRRIPKTAFNGARAT